MPPEILALIDKPWWLAAILAVGAMIGMAVEISAVQMRRRAWRKRNPKRWNNGTRSNGSGTAEREPNGNRPVDAADQLRIVMNAQFSAQPLLNKSEARVFKDLDQMVLSCNPRWQVMAQVSLGEILTSHNAQAYSCINAKRVDLLLVDEHCHPRHVFEYQGGGHYQGTAAARDAVKKEALRRAGITYHEVVGGHTTAAELRQLVERLVPCVKIAS
jgi:hypothetical protein